MANRQSIACGELMALARCYEMDGMEPIEEIRRTNLLLLISRYDGQRKLADAIRKAPSQVSQWVSRSAHSKTGKPRSIGSQIAREIETVLGLPSGWMDAAHGLMEPTPGMRAEPGAVVAKGSPGYHLDTLSPWDDGTPLDDDEIEVPLYREVELAAGSGMVHTVEINGRKLRFSKATMRAAGVESANAACATLTGNSMERLIQNGSTIGIDRGRTQIADGEIYAIDHDGMLRVKYLYRLPGGGLRLRSENNEEHPDEVYPADSAAKIKVLGWVFWWSTVRKWRGR